MMKAILSVLSMLPAIPDAAIGMLSVRLALGSSAAWSAAGMLMVPWIMNQPVRLWWHLPALSGLSCVASGCQNISIFSIANSF